MENEEGWGGGGGGGGGGGELSFTDQSGMMMKNGELHFILQFLKISFDLKASAYVFDPKIQVIIYITIKWGWTKIILSIIQPKLA